MNKLINFENVVKLCTGLIVACGLYYSLKQEQALINQKLDYLIARVNEKENEARLVLAEIKGTDLQQSREISELREKLIRICAVLPKRINIETENEND